MARKRLNTVDESANVVSELEQLIDFYSELKNRINELDKKAKADNTKIKELMNSTVEEDEEGKRVFSGKEYIATLSTRDTSKMNEEKLIAYLKEHGLAKGIVKKKEYIDEKAFEDAVYTHKISEEQLVEMDTCKDYSTTQYLTVKKIKGDK